MKRWTTLLFSFLLLLASNVSASHWNQSQQEIIAFNEHLPFAINQDEFTQYEQHFHPNYQHVNVEKEQHITVKRDAYLRGKKLWSEFGNYVTFNDIRPIEVVVESKFANSKFIRETHFVDSFGRTAKQLEYVDALYERYKGKWTLIRLATSNDITDALNKSESAPIWAE